MNAETCCDVKVFLGGTCNGSEWREELKPLLTLEHFDPVVDDWDEAAQVEELLQRDICEFVLYCITSEMSGVYSIAEAVDDSNKRPKKTIFCVLEDGFDKSQLKSLKAVSDLIKNNGGATFSSIEKVADYLNAMPVINGLNRIIGNG